MRVFIYYLLFQFDSYYTCSCKKERKKERKFEIKHRVWYTLVIIEQHIEKKKRILTCVISAILSATQMTKKVCSICEANMFIELVV